MKVNYNGVYGRNKVCAIETKGGLFCRSYDTIVCGIVKGKLKRYWSGYSKTTMSHVGQFVDDYNVSVATTGKGSPIEWNGVKTWDEMKVCNCPIRLRIAG